MIKNSTSFLTIKTNSVLKNTMIVLIFILSSHGILAQSFSIGHTTKTFFDSSRNRNIETEIYYPASTSGNDVSIATGNFPVLVFGHGFLMAWSAYQNFWERLVPEGYILCFPKTEGSLTPNHSNFGNDLKFIAAQMQSENTNSTSLFFGAVASQTALMGHSMGGGSSFLGAANNSNISALVNFAAAETNPSAISAALNVNVPTLMFSGADDCVTPESSNQNPMYANLASLCKTKISIINGVHCYYANSNFNCNAGEFFCNSSPDISRALQQSTTFGFLVPWLDFTLKGNTESEIAFNNLLESSNQITFIQSCSTLNTLDFSPKKEIVIFPNPILDIVNIHVNESNLGGKLIIYNMLGQNIYSTQINSVEAQIDLSDFGNGVYFFNYDNSALNYAGKFVKTGKR